MTPSRSPGQRAGLSQQAVLATARTLLAEGGLERLTMRALAHRLQVAPNALYSHVASKDALVAALLDDLLAAVVAPPAGTEPHAGLRQIMSATYALLREHPDFVPLFLARQGSRGPHAQRLGKVMDALLAQAGVTGDAATAARRVLIIYTIGFAGVGTGDRTSQPPLSGEVLHADFDRGIRWLLHGILSAGATPAT